MRLYCSLPYILLPVIFLCAAQGISQDLTCEPDVEYQGEVYMNYGSTTNAVNQDHRTTLSLGQTVVGTVNGVENRGGYGYFSRFLLPPSEPVVTVSQGDFPDRVQLSWVVDPLSPVASDGFKIFRDGAFLANLDKDTKEFIDFNVQAGEVYEYEVVGFNSFGSGYPRSAVGFINPNGFVSGEVVTASGNPVPGVVVRLTPKTGASLKFDGMNDQLCIDHSDAYTTNVFTVSAYVKMPEANDGKMIIDRGSSLKSNWWIRAVNRDGKKGYAAYIGDGTNVDSLVHLLVPESPTDITYEDEWHQVSLTYNGASMTLLVDGEFSGTQAATLLTADHYMNVGSSIVGSDFFKGSIDDIRMYNRVLTQTEVMQSMNRSVSSSEAGLIAYWKMDEGIGDKAFDISLTQVDAKIYGASFDSSTPEVYSAGLTDVSGLYDIEGINYSAVQSFKAQPMKDFYFDSALEFSAAEETCADMTEYDIPDSSTIELTFHPFDLKSTQSILHKEDHFELWTANGLLFLEINGALANLGPIEARYYRISVTIDNGLGEALVYINGEEEMDISFTPISDWSGGPWLLGADLCEGSSQYYTGLIDEFVVFNGLLPHNYIQLNDVIGTPSTGYRDTLYSTRQLNGQSVNDTTITDYSIFSYFDLNEGIDAEIVDYAAVNDTTLNMPRVGTISNASWSTNVRHKASEAHEFEPNIRVVNINKSNTAVGNIDFTDVSTVNVSGTVRYDNSFCFAEQVEILVNGRSNIPPIYTDMNGEWSADFEPGASVILTPEYKDHTFTPTFMEFRKLQVPKAGVVFLDDTKRTISGQIAGGLCKKSIIPDGSRVIVKIEALNGCIEREHVVTVEDGKYKFENLPAVAYSVSIIEHSNSVIYNFFQNKGGEETDLRDVAADTIDFIYFSPPQLELVPFDVNSCGATLMNQNSNYTLRAKVFQNYDGGLCYMDSAYMRVVNDIADESSFDTIMTGAEFVYTFKAGGPNILSPYDKKIEIVATIADGSSTAASQNAVVLGKKASQASFASASPEIPLIILRDPPGDESYASIEEGSTTCTTFEVDVTDARNSELSIGLSLGANSETSVGIGAEVTLEIEATADYGLATSMSFSSGKNEGIETCLTTTEVFATSNGDIIVGDQGGDLFIGAAFNFLYGTSFDLLYDESICEFNIDTNLTVFPDGFATRYAYTEYHIRNVEIPRLILNDSLAAAEMWQTILDRNTTLKEQAVFSENISFSAGATFEKSKSTETTASTSYNFDIENSTEFTEDFGLAVNGVGFSAGLSMELTQSKSRAFGQSELASRTVSYALGDDDIGDNFTVDIKEDKVYGTPVFDLISGKSMCPYESNTLNREEVFISIDRNNAINISENTDAVFNLTVGNLSDEFKVYTVTHVPESNPNGAIVMINGKQSAQELEIDAGSTLDLTLTVGRGPVEFTYEDLGVAIFSACEDDRADFLGIDIDDRFYQELAFNVEFIEPCSKVEITAPQQDWVVTPLNNNTLNINLSEYDIEDIDLELIRVQYRRIGGDGSWINIDEVSKGELLNNDFLLQWNTELLQDDKYEIRAITQCTSIALNPGISTILRGTLEREPPELFGLPQPSDGTWDPGDEISITFSEEIDCDKVFKADDLGNNTIGLYDVTTDQLVDATISCLDNKIIIVPNVNPVFFENRGFRVTISGKEYDDAKIAQDEDHVNAALRDKAGNAIPEDISWEFFVNQNNLEWVGTNVEIYDEVLKPTTAVRQIRNRGGTIATFRIENVPSWLTVTPSTGTLNPGQLSDVIFEFQEDLLIGDYNQTIQLSGSRGDEPLTVDYHVRCPAPDWSVSDRDGQDNMTFTLELDIFGEKSIDESDMIAAFINGEIRGVANIEYSRELDKYLAFLTVNHDQSGDTIELNVFDGDKCIIYAEVLEDFNYEINGIEGTPLVPTVIHVDNIIRQTIPLTKGWNWISVNIDYPDNKVENVLSTLMRPAGALIKDDNHFARNYNGVWVGSLTSLSYDTRYMYNAPLDDELVLTGVPYDLASSSKSINVGWNWIGFTPQQGMSPNTAFGSLTPLNGDIIKSQTKFAQYVAGKGWIGNLNFLEPGEGYLLNVKNAGTLIYPQTNILDARPATTYREKSKKQWEVDYSQYQENMNVIAIVKDMKRNKSMTSMGDEVSVVINGEVRGSSKAEYIESLDAYQFFITVYGVNEGEEMSFQYFNSKTKKVYKMSETELFQQNTMSGSVADPLVLSFLTSSNILNDVPDQSIHFNDEFEQIDLTDYVDDPMGCQDFKVDYVIPVGSSVAPLICERPVYENSMSVILKPVYGDSTAYNSPNDRIILRNPSGEIVECGVPIDDNFHIGKKIYYLSVGGYAQSYKVSMEFYSDYYKQTYQIDSVFTYSQGGELGVPDTAYLVDMSHVKHTLAGSNFDVDIQSEGWIGMQEFVVTSYNCEGSVSGRDTIVYSNDCPLIQLSVMDGVTLDCLTDPGVPLTATAIGGTGQKTYTWTNSSGGIIAHNQNISNGDTYYVTVRDEEGCGRTDSVTVTRNSDPLESVGTKFLLGPAVICAETENVPYSINTTEGISSIEWSYVGEGVDIVKQPNGLIGLASFPEGSSSGHIKATLSNYCSTKSDSLLVSYADPFWCGLYSDCKTDVEISSSVLNTSNTPQLFQAGQTMTLLGLVPLKHYEFTAGSSIEFKANFEVPLGAQIQADIQPCIKD